MLLWDVPLCTHNGVSMEFLYLLAKRMVMSGVVACGIGFRIGPIIFIQVLFDRGLMHSSCQHLAVEYWAE